MSCDLLPLLLLLLRMRMLLRMVSDLWDVRRLLSLSNGSTVLTTAISLRQKTFVCHPFAQEYLNELWLREYYGHRSCKDLTAGRITSPSLPTLSRAGWLTRSSIL